MTHDHSAERWKHDGVRVIPGNQLDPGHLESIIYVVRAKARMRWGDRLQFTAEANPGDFIFIPPYVPHQEINASPDQILECVLVRSDGEAIAINLDIEPVEKPETVLWVDPIHRDPRE